MRAEAVTREQRAALEQLGTVGDHELTLRPLNRVVMRSLVLNGWATEVNMVVFHAYSITDAGREALRLEERERP